ncbi:hypothetical protein BIW11_14235 [Tropilaelaps mercedesae]|uniref:UMA domain-containing protein n=1 Tax=Tropilaelaps mercedesae TaxID=418985 RepID=A0A1V9WYM3_9ACAR|nr:hypothetical protein BIW11_14235 [Tropilaelaps mercedesae]
MSLFSALFGSSKPKKDQRSASVTSLPQASTTTKPEQDFVVLQDSDFKVPSRPQYPDLSGLHVSQPSGTGGPSSLPPNHLIGAMDTLPRQALDKVPFKLDSKLSSGKSGDQAWGNLTRSLNDIGSRIEEYAYDFKLEHTVLTE